VKPADYVAIIGGVLVPLLLAVRAAWAGLNKKSDTALNSIIRIETVITERGETNKLRHDTLVMSIAEIKSEHHTHTEDDRKLFGEIRQELKTLEIAGAKR